MGNCFSSRNNKDHQQIPPQKQQQQYHTPPLQSKTTSAIPPHPHPPVKVETNDHQHHNHEGVGGVTSKVSSPPSDESNRREEPSPPKASSSTPAGANSNTSHPKNVTELRENAAYTNVDIFSYEEMTSATTHFRPDYILGEGGFGIVYKGVLDSTIRPSYNTTQVAIKELNPEGFQGDREWLAEVNYLGQLRHPNLVKLIGYCCEDEHRLLVYEYMARGSLEKHLFRRAGSNLTWSKRINIALDAAKGLAFLHGAERSVIYRDFKTSNILLDSKFNAKLSDFGLAKDGPRGDQTHVSTRVMGTYGYAAPEYVMTGHLTARSDVYGFGVVLLEILIGRRAMDKSRPSREHNLVDWARPLLNNNKKILRLLDPKMEGQYSASSAMKVATLTYECLSQKPKERPLMSEVVQLLETIQTTQDSLVDNQSGVTSDEVSTKSGVANASVECRNTIQNGRSRSESPSELDPSK